MPKPNPLTQGLEQHSQASRSKPPLPTDTLVKAPANAGPPSRSGRVLVGGHFSPAVQTALKVIAAEERTTMQALLTEGINTVFARRSKPEIADM